MRLVRLAVLYTAVALGANAATAGTVAELEALRDGDMRKLVLHDDARPLPDVALVDTGDVEHRLSDLAGRIVVLNFWATWCAPCRHEMPSLDRLQAALGGDDLAVVPVATGRNPVPAIQRFYNEAGIANLPVLRDPGSTLARQMGVLGLPVTVILNREGQEVARLTGDAEWDSESAVAILTALVAGGV